MSFFDWLGLAALILVAGFLGASWQMWENDYNRLEWKDTVQTKPTLAEIESAWPAVEATDGKEKANTPIQAKLDKADLKIIRALVEGDTVRIEAHKTAQAVLRAQLR